MKQLVEPKLSENALAVLERRYLAKDEQGRVVETPAQMFWRVARDIASAELNYDPQADVEAVADQFYWMMAELDFLPNSPTLMNAGRELQQLAACFVLPVGDSMESIFETLKATALIHKSGGGTGFSFSRLRPKNDPVSTTGGIASGPVSFMKVFNAATEAIKQGGTRRGANMAILAVDHPDIMEFIHCKQDTAALNNFNISVGLTEKFMQAVESDADYPLLNPRSGQEVRRLAAREVFDEIVKMAWLTGDPGIVFLDRINADNPTPQVDRIESTNPCGEQPLLPYESCNLGSINLAHMISATGPSASLRVNDRQPATGASAQDIRSLIDWDKLAHIVELAVRFLDNVVDRNHHPLEEIHRMTVANRKIGLGVMGWADLLIELGIPYDSEQALELGDQMMRFIREEARKSSQRLAEQRGAFPNWEGSIYHPELPLRNATLTTVAPTGTLSIIAGCSSGIEPLFAVVYTRTIMEGRRFLEVHSIFERIAQERGFHSQELMERVSAARSLGEVEGIPDDIKRLFVCAYDVTPEWHVRTQAAFQRYTDNAVSKTVNFAHDAAPGDVRQVYLLAYRLGCKGVTVYREGSKAEQVLTIGKGEGSATGGRQPEAEDGDLAIGKAATPEPRSSYIEPRPRPEMVTGQTRKMKTACGNLYITLNADEHGLCEVFTSMGKTGGCTASQSEAISRLISLSLRSGIDPRALVAQLKGIRCPNPCWYNGGQILSCADAIAQAIHWYLGGGLAHGPHQLPAAGAAEAGIPVPAAFGMGAVTAAPVGAAGYPAGGDGFPLSVFRPQCPECGGALETIEGCLTCRGCGFSRCE